MHKFFGPLDDMSFKINGRDWNTHVILSRTRFRTLKPNFTRFRTRFLVLPPGGVSGKKHKISGPIKTVVVLVMENCSFDHVLGWLKRSRPDIDGLGGGEWNPLSTLDPSSPSSSSPTMPSSSTRTQGTRSKPFANKSSDPTRGVKTGVDTRLNPQNNLCRVRVEKNDTQKIRVVSLINTQTRIDPYF